VRSRPLALHERSLRHRAASGRIPRKVATSGPLCMSRLVEGERLRTLAKKDLKISGMSRAAGPLAHTIAQRRGRRGSCQADGWPEPCRTRIMPEGNGDIQIGSRGRDFLSLNLKGPEWSARPFAEAQTHRESETIPSTIAGANGRVSGTEGFSG
jgi:hypothetical protein